MKILLVEPFFSGSHRKWSLALQGRSRHDIDLLTLPGRHWKWRMHGAAVTLAQRVNASEKNYDIVLASDMLDLASFLGLLAPEKRPVRSVLYFHENQLTYPWSPEDEDVDLKRDRHYAFINYTSALAADACWFNSDYHRLSFLEALPRFLSAFPDHQNIASIEDIRTKSSTVWLGMELQDLLTNSLENVSTPPVLLWNHRWEYDKNPDDFFKLCLGLEEKGLNFRLNICGEHTGRYPAIFDEMKKKLAHRIDHFGYAESRDVYHRLLYSSHILPVTAIQDFFGGSTVEAMAAGCLPVLPRRLAYPSHVPTDLQSQLIYDDQRDLIDKVTALISHPSLVSTEDLRAHVKRYDWGGMIHTYDEAFEALM